MKNKAFKAYIEKNLESYPCGSGISQKYLSIWGVSFGWREAPQLYNNQPGWNILPSGEASKAHNS
jgi:hypothetical protein